MTSAADPVSPWRGPARTLEIDGRAVRVTDLSAFDLSRMPYCLRPILESVVRHEGADHPQVAALLAGAPAAGAAAAGTDDDAASIDLHATRVFLHDTNGVPVLVDLTAMRDAAAARGADPALVNPQIPAELVTDHSVIVDVFGTPDALERNVEIEFERNAERYRFLRWASRSYRDFAVVPPGTGIMHQINLEHLARVIEERDGWAYPDVCLGTDSHTTMVDALGVLGWGIGGIESEAVMLGEPVSMLVPPVVRAHLTGALPEGATATDLVLRITERLRQEGVVGSFVEFVGPALATMSVADRATIANMCPEFGATCAYFPIDQATIDYLRLTGRPEERVRLVETYAREQGLWYDPEAELEYAATVEIDLGSIVPSIAGPRRPQDRVPLDVARERFRADLQELTQQSPDDPPAPLTLRGAEAELRNGSVAIAAITSCTNTSNPDVMVAAGLLARKAVERGLAVKPWVKTSLSPGSRVVTDYLAAAGLTESLDRLGFQLTGFGCMTCIGASGPLIPEVQDAVREHGTSVAAVLSGNRNFDGRINPDVRLNYLASPPLVVAYALAGTVDVDFATQPLGTGADGAEVYLRDVWPSDAEVRDLVRSSIDADMFSAAYASVFTGNAAWNAIEAHPSARYAWEAASDYLRRPPYFDAATSIAERRADSDADSGAFDIRGARVLAKLGDQITTDHLSPAGAILPTSAAGRYLLERGTARHELNTYASRRGNHEVMMRGTLANVRLRNALVEREGGYTLDLVEGTGEQTIYDAAMIARRHDVPLVILGGALYGAGSSRDWGAKGPALLGVRAVIAQSFERIHRSNLVGMGVLPLEFPPGESADTLGLTGREEFDIRGLGDDAEAHTVEVRAGDVVFTARVRLDTERERAYYRAGGILPFVLEKLIAG